MTVTPDQVDFWRKSRGEHQRLEFKEAKEQFDWDDLLRYCVALANEGGGSLVLGISNRDSFPVVGTKSFSNPVKTAEKLFETLRFRVEVDEVPHPEGRIIVFTAPARPRGSAYSRDGAFLMRNGAQLVPMSEDRLRSIFAEGQPDWLEEPSLDGLSADEVVALLDTQSFFDLFRLPYPISRDGVIDRLLSERMITHGNLGFSILRIGAVLFAKDLGQFPDVAPKAIRVIIYKGTDNQKTHLDQFGAKGYAAGFQGLVQFVMQQLPQNEVIEEALRRETKLVPEDVVRELAANALIHQDFCLTGMRPTIQIFSNRVEFSNPGDPLVPVERFIDGYRTRNERLADVMRRIGICEEKSSGIDRVVRAAEVHQLPAPDFRSSLGRTVVTIFGHQSFEAMDRDARLRACYQHAALKLVLAERMTNQSLRDRFRLPEHKASTVSAIISAAVEAKLIKADERAGASKKYARYLPEWA